MTAMQTERPPGRLTADNGVMKAIVQERYGPPEGVLTLREVDRPPVGDDDVLIRVRATSVNTPDWITVTGTPYVIRLRFGCGSRRPLCGVPMSPGWWRPSAGT